jgi:predicted O-methyltransferase YrrM
LGGLFKGGAKPFAAMAAEKAKQAAIDLAKRKAAEAAANLAKAAAEKTGLTGVVGQDAVNSVAGGAGDLAVSRCRCWC